MQYEISATVENSLRVLQRVTTVLSKHRLNIESLHVDAIIDSMYSKLVITTVADSGIMDTVKKQMQRIVELVDIDVIDNS